MVAPTDHLRTQWADAAARMGIGLDAALTNATGPVRPDLTGYVTTYAQVAAKPALHHARVVHRRTLVVLDEVHHAGDGLSWGDAVATAFDAATRRLCLTGTPFRTRPDERIPFVRYEPDGEGGWRSSADFSYGYREALADGVVRPVVFAAYTGTSRWRNSAGEVIAASLSETSTRRTESTAWRTALNPKGRWVPHVIAAMDERITHLRDERRARRRRAGAGQRPGRRPRLRRDRRAGHRAPAGADPVRRPQGRATRSPPSPPATSAWRSACGWCPRASTCRAPPAWPG